MNGQTFSPNPCKQGKSHHYHNICFQANFYLHLGSLLRVSLGCMISCTFRFLVTISVMKKLLCWSQPLWLERVQLQLVSWWFKPRKPQRITSGLKETFIKRCTVERTNKAERWLKEQSEKAESCWDNL